MPVIIDISAMRVLHTHTYVYIYIYIYICAYIYRYTLKYPDLDASSIQNGSASEKQWSAQFLVYRGKERLTQSQMQQTRQCGILPNKDGILKLKWDILKMRDLRIIKN